MFAVIFEVHPKPGLHDAYLHNAGLLRPELVQVDGFIDNVRYGSLRRPGWVLSLSTWRDEKALVRWRIHALHHAVQEKGRFEIFSDYHLRVGQVTADTHIPAGHALREQRLDETETGDAKAVSLIEIQRPADFSSAASAEEIARRLGWREDAAGLVDWDILDAILTPGAMLLLLCWRDAANATDTAPPGARRRQVRVVRTYGMARREEAPQYYREITP